MVKLSEKIIERIKALGGNIALTEGESLLQVIASISFPYVLYRRYEGEKPDEQIGDIFYDYIMEHKALYDEQKEKFYETFFNTFFVQTEEYYAQYFWEINPFTPYEEGTSDHQEFHTYMQEYGNIAEICEKMGCDAPSFIHIFDANDYPDSYYLVQQDSSDDPVVFSTDHEVFFSEVDAVGTLSQFLHEIWTKEELREAIECFMQKQTNSK